MTKLIATLTLFAALVAMAGSVEARTISNQSCISYWSVGDSGCDGTKKQKEKAAETQNLLPDPVLEEGNQPSKLPEHITSAPEEPIEEKIDDFLLNFEKPPREFAKFQMEPTLDNAMSWVHKYNEMVEHSGRIAAAWRQAQTIYTEAQKTGVVLPGMQGEEAKIPDYQAQIARMYPQLAADLEAQAAAANGGAPQVDPSNIRIGGLADQQNIGSLTPDDAFAAASAQGNGQIKISYYFSAECPYCKKFEPEFKKVIKDMKGKLDVTCVDMSPSDRSVSNIYGKVDCAWRPIQAGEMERLGVTATPTLIINRGDGSALQRIPGFVNSDQLKKFLVTNKPN